MTTTHDTAATLEAAIDDYGNATAREAMNADERAALHSAIAAHVEAEVARRLAAAPGVEEAIFRHDDATYWRGYRHGGGKVPPDWEDVPRDDFTLRAAIAADKARAVAAAISPAVHELRNALPPVRHHAQRIEPGDRREAILRGVDRALAVADELAAVLDGGPARVGPTPDEARRLVEAFVRAVSPARYDKDTALTARTALLRALGVEA